MSTLMVSLLVLAAAHEPPRRAVLVGSNSAIEGRNPLHFAHSDARSLADVLTSSGGFTKKDVVVLLEATPAQVLAALDEARAALAGQGDEGLLVFYYSGHADHRALYPAGQELPLEQLRGRLSSDAAGVRIGIIDACRGGGWTQTKGLSPAAPFEVGVPALSSEGTALLSASSGLEDAHEAEALQGSFFTHHLVAGLRGAADTTGDSQVTLSEAFAYANRLTIRDTATTARIPQHPSFDLRLRGRQDVVLTTLGSSETQLVLSQTEGPLEVVQLSTGVTVVEAAPGEQVLRLSLPPGPYLVRRLHGGQVFSKEVQVKAHEATRLEESSLTIVGMAEVAHKGGAFRGQHELGASLGLAPFDTYSTGLNLSVDYTVFFSRVFGWRIKGTYNYSINKAITQQLQRDFSVDRTAFNDIVGEAHTGVAWATQVIANHQSEFLIGMTLGPGAMVLYPLGGSQLTARPALAASIEFTWKFLPHLGLRLGFSDVVAFSIINPGVSPIHLASVNLAVVGWVGPAR
jgi:hypothetical protein